MNPYKSLILSTGYAYLHTSQYVSYLFIPERSVKNRYTVRPHFRYAMLTPIPIPKKEKKNNPITQSSSSAYLSLKRETLAPSHTRPQPTT
jgi:hypothetical protein